MNTVDRSTTFEIGLLALIAAGVMVLMGFGAWEAKEHFDPSAYLVVLTLIVGAIKERWLSRSVDKMGQKLADSTPSSDGATKDAADGAQQTADAATRKAGQIEARAKT